MEEIQSSEDLTINQQDVEDAIVEVLEEVLLNVVYDDNLVGGWIDSICEQAIKRLYDMNKPYKYCVSCFIMQKTGAAI
jgi:dynein light chain Tctex-type 1